MTRWVFPLCIVWGQLFLSAFVFQRRLPTEVQGAPNGLLLLLLFAGPAVSAVLLVACRRLDREPSLRSTSGDAVVVWFLAYGFAVHGLILATTIRMVPSLHPGLSWVTGGLLVGLGILFPSLPLGSPFGVVHAGSTRSEQAWRQVHRRMAFACGASGLAAFALSPWLSSSAIWVASMPVLGVLLWEVGVMAPRFRRAE